MTGSRKALAPALALALALLSSISSSPPSLASDDLYGPARGHLPLTDSRKKRSISLYYIGHHLRGEYNARRRTDEEPPLPIPHERTARERPLCRLMD